MLQPLWRHLSWSIVDSIPAVGGFPLQQGRHSHKQPILLRCPQLKYLIRVVGAPRPSASEHGPSL